MVFYITQGSSGSFQTNLIAVTMLQPGIQITGIQFQIRIDPVVSHALLLLQPLYFLAHQFLGVFVCLASAASLYKLFVSSTASCLTY